MFDLYETVTVFSGEYNGKTGKIIGKSFPLKGSNEPPTLMIRLESGEEIIVDVRDM